MKNQRWSELVGGRILIHHQDCDVPVEVIVMEVSPMERYLLFKFIITDACTWIDASKTELLEILPDQSAFKDIATSWKNMIDLREGDGDVRLHHTEQRTIVYVKAKWTDYREESFTGDNPLEAIRLARETQNKRVIPQR